MKSQFKRLVTLIRTKEKYLPLLKDKWKYLIALFLIFVTKDTFPVLGYFISGLTFLVLIHDTFEVIRFVRAIDLIANDKDKNSFPFSSVPRKPSIGEPTNGNPEILNLVALQQGCEREEYTFEKVWFDDSINKILWESSEFIGVSVHKKKYLLPPDLAEIAAPVIAQAGRKAQGGVRGQPICSMGHALG